MFIAILRTSFLINIYPNFKPIDHDLPRVFNNVQFPKKKNLFIILFVFIWLLLQPELIPFWGYKMENYTVRTDDNYLLTLHRIANHNSSYPPILFQHGILLASDVWILRGPHEDLGKSLANTYFIIANTFAEKTERNGLAVAECVYGNSQIRNWWDRLTLNNNR